MLFYVQYSEKRKVYVYWSHSSYSFLKWSTCVPLALEFKMGMREIHFFGDFFSFTLALILGWCKIFLLQVGKSARTYFSYGTCYMKCVYLFSFSRRSTLKREKKMLLTEKFTEVNCLSNLKSLEKNLGGWLVEGREVRLYIWEGGEGPWSCIWILVKVRARIQ